MSRNASTSEGALRKPRGAAAPTRKAAMEARAVGVRRKPEPVPLAVAYPTGRGRKALKGISIYMHPLAKDVLDKIAREQAKTVQDLGLEALNLLFTHYGEKPIA